MSPDLHHLSGAYAVDALDDAERTSFEQHLAVCADCRAEVAELSAAAALPRLAHRGDAAPVAARLGAVRHRPGPPAPPLTEDAGAPDAGAPDRPVRRMTGEPDAGGTVVPIRRRRRTAWFAAAAAAAVIAIGGLAWSPWSDDAGSQSPMAQVTAADDAMTVSTTKDGATAEVAYSKPARQGGDLGDRAAARTGRQDLPALVRRARLARPPRPACSASMPRAADRPS